MEESTGEAGSDSTSVLRDQTARLNANVRRDSGLQCCDRNAESEEDYIYNKLDISSDQFDPLLALYSPKVPLPYPNIKCFNNIAEYESFMKGGRGRAKPENAEKKLRKPFREVTDPERIARLKKLVVNNLAEEVEGKKNRRKQKARKNVLTRMSLHEGSPLGELNRCVQERIRVKVHIRSFKGLRGVCTGFLVAFDKFWNLAMVDVDETYRKPLFGEAFYHEKALTVTRLIQKLQVQERQEHVTDQKDSGEVDTSKPDGPSSEPHCTTRHVARSNQWTKPTAQHRLDTSSEQRQKDPKPKAEYGRVCTRHVNQLFIRGENVLLVNVQQE